MTNFYTMTEPFLKRLRFRDNDKCYSCERPFKPGEDVVSTTSNSKTKRFHLICYNRRYLVLKPQTVTA